MCVTIPQLGSRFLDSVVVRERPILLPRPPQAHLSPAAPSRGPGEGGAVGRWQGWGEPAWAPQNLSELEFLRNKEDELSGFIVLPRPSTLLLKHFSLGTQGKLDPQDPVLME